MLTLDISRFSIEIDDGAIENVGAMPTTATVAQYDVETATVSEFGDDRVKLAFTDEDDNTVEIALAPEDVRDLAADVESLAEGSDVFE
ncbi:MAG: hypothetical protein ABEJ77_03765 [Halanaeroarchaeum sp.]